jgi:hypothetical protein
LAIVGHAERVCAEVKVVSKHNLSVSSVDNRDVGGNNNSSELTIALKGKIQDNF